MQSQWLTVPRPDSGSVSVVPREPACAEGGRWRQSFSGSCGRDWHWRWHWLRCQLRGWPHTQLTNSETLFVAFPLRLFASLQYTLLSHALPSFPPPPCLPLARELTVVTKVYAASIWTAFHYGATCKAGLVQSKGKCKCKFCSGAILKTLWLPYAPPPPRSTKFNPPTEHCASLLWPCAGECAPNEAYKWPLSWLQLELELGTGIGYTATRLLASGMPLFTNMLSAVSLPWLYTQVYCIGKYSHDNRNFYWIYAKIANFICHTQLWVLLLLLLCWSFSLVYTALERVYWIVWQVGKEK